MTSRQKNNVVQFSPTTDGDKGETSVLSQINKIRNIAAFISDGPTRVYFKNFCDEMAIDYLSRTFRK